MQGDRPLLGRTAMVVGASSGIGLATAALFLDAGARVYGIARRYSAMVQGVGEDRMNSGRFIPYAADVTDRDAVRRAVDAAGNRDGIDIVVYATGINVVDRSLDRLTPDNWDSLLRTNLDGVFAVLHPALPYLRTSRGALVLVSSVSALWTDLSGPAYQATKAGMLALARAVALEEHQRGIRVTSIMPGMVDTPLLEQRPSPPDAALRALMLKPEDVARACLFVVTLPAHAYVPELTILPTRLQALGATTLGTPHP